MPLIDNYGKPMRIEYTIASNGDLTHDIMAEMVRGVPKPVPRDRQQQFWQLATGNLDSDPLDSIYSISSTLCAATTSGTRAVLSWRRCGTTASPTLKSACTLTAGLLMLCETGLVPFLLSCCSSCRPIVWHKRSRKEKQGKGKATEKQR